jgi:tripartite-type tricarboxylate transporter receptor subunit TctC
VGRLVRLLLAALCCGTFAASAAAQGKFPNHALRIVVPYVPGGGSDITARLLGDQLHKLLGQPVVVENKPGANGIISIEEMLHGKPDGYTMLIVNNTVGVLTPLQYPKQLGINFEKAVVPVVRLAVLPQMLVTTTSNFAPKTLAEFVAYAKAHPGKVRFGSTGVGSFPHLDMEVLGQKLGLDMVHIPNKGGAAAAIQDLVTGDVQVAPMNVTTGLPMVKAGKIRVLAVGSDQRLADYPGVPTMAELGYPHILSMQWFAFVAPAGVPADVLKTLHDACVNAMKAPEVVDAFKKQMLIPDPSSSPADAKAFLDGEFVRMKEVLKEFPLNLEH